MLKFGSQSGFYKSFSSSPQLNYQLTTYEWRTRRFDSLEIASLKQNEIGNPEKINLIFDTKSKTDKTLFFHSHANYYKSLSGNYHFSSLKNSY